MSSPDRRPENGRGPLYRGQDSATRDLLHVPSGSVSTNGCDPASRHTFCRLMNVPERTFCPVDRTSTADPEGPQAGFLIVLVAPANAG